MTKSEKSIIIADTDAHSGSIVSISNIASGVVDEVTFGTYVEGSDDINHQTYTTDINLASYILEGPISNFKLTSGAVLVRYNRELT